MVFARNPNKQKELAVPPSVTADVTAVEIARIWASNGKQVVTLRPELWEDPAAWGLMLVDFAKHVANAYEQLGNGSKEEVLKRIKWGFDVEWNKPTTEPKGEVQG
ncbi:MAG: hypothetical protein A2283_03660 [Lentisphaerae bacterium RIFOXYA12_FULL_48_11]|nr:MAG: hypothetical protein A2283_03660 [Lentisphaerae bacterium RIFOXYA12_FULL_48_11]